MCDLVKWKDFLSEQGIPFFARKCDTGRGYLIDIGYDEDGDRVADYDYRFGGIPNASLGIAFDEDGYLVEFRPTGE